MDRPAIVASVDSLEAIDDLPAGADLIELRLDRLDDPPQTSIDQAWPCQLILTNRAADEGGDASGPDRLSDLATLAHADEVWAIDIELEAFLEDEPTAHEAIEAAASSDTLVICSTHLDGVPAADDLRARLDTAGTHGDIAKLAVPADEPAHLGRLVEVTSEAIEDGQSVATMATGRYALASRVTAIALGVDLVYGAVPGFEPVAPGQPTTTVLRSVRDGSV